MAVDERQNYHGVFDTIEDLQKKITELISLMEKQIIKIITTCQLIYQNHY